MKRNVESEWSEQILMVIIAYFKPERCSLQNQSNLKRISSLLSFMIWEKNKNQNLSQFWHEKAEYQAV